MNERLTQIIQQLHTFWQKLSSSQKLMLGAGVLMLAIALIMVFRASQPKYVPVFSQLQLDTAGEVTAKLEELKIPYKLSDGGATILVPEKQKYQTRIELANEGLPKGVVGFEIFNETKFGETDTDKKVRFMIALQGELTRTIESMSEVETAAVHIAMPEQPLFSDDNQPVTASVMLKLKSGVKLSGSQIQGLVHFVASGVERLKPENVTVIDVSGAILSQGLFGQESSGTGKLSSTQMETRRVFEQDMEKSIQSMLEQIIGSGKAVVRVSATLDFDSIEINRENWGDKVERSVETTEESGQDQTGAATGAAGTTSNIPGQKSIDTQGSIWQKTGENRTYEIDKENIRQLVAPGSIKQLSIAVVVDGNLQPAVKSAIEEAVSRAAGVSSNRGDQITVTALPFDRSQAESMQAEIEAAARNARIRTYITYGAVALGIGLMAWLILMVVRRSKGLKVNYKLGAEVPVQPVHSLTLELSPEDQRRSAVKEQVEKLVRESPDDVAQLLKTWLIEDTR